MFSRRQEGGSPEEGGQGPDFAVLRHADEALRKTLGFDLDIERPSAVPDFCLSPAGLAAWFESEGLKTAVEHGLMAGSGPVPVKGVCDVLFHHLLEQNYLNPHRYSIPRTLIVPPDAFSGLDSLEWKNLKKILITDGRFELKRVVRKAIAELPALQEALSGFAAGAGESQKIIVRSMSQLEGGPGQSAAGAFESVVASNLSIDSLAQALSKVVLSAYSPLPIYLANRQGLEPRAPGFKLQDFIDGPEVFHAIFNTAIPGEVRGICSFHNYHDPRMVRSDLTSKSFRFPTGKRPRIEGMNDLGESAVEELARIFSAGGQVPVEMEFVYDPRQHKIMLLQHRFVCPAVKASAPIRATNVCVAREVAGSGTVAVRDVLWLRGFYGDLDSGLPMWLLAKRLEREEKPYIVLLDSMALSCITHSSSEGYRLSQAMLLRAAAMVEMHRANYKVNSASAHFPRVLSDLGRVFMNVDYHGTEFPHSPMGRPVSIFGRKVIEYIFPRLSDWQVEDRGHLGTEAPGSAEEVLERADIEKGPVVLRLKKPIIVHGCERTQSGGIYLPR